jgi:hypothetical protein
MMNKNKFSIMEVKPDRKGYYFVTLHQFKKEEELHPDYIQDWLEYDGSEWDYFAGYSDTCYVCFIHKRDEDK